MTHFKNITTMIKKVVISPSAKDKAIAFFESMKARKEEAKRRSEARTEELKSRIVKAQAK